MMKGDIVTKAAVALSKLRLVAVAGISLALAYFGGHEVGKARAERECEAARAELAEAQTKTVVQYQTVEREKRIEVKVRDIARERALEADVSTLRDERDFLQKVIHEAPPPHDGYACRLSLGDVRVLNYAAAPARSDPASRVPGAADIAAFEEQTPSTVSCRAFVSTGVDIRLQYNELARRHDALVAWTEEELINSQLDRSQNTQ